ncbi:hypothetical protein Cgig2_025111 [Carnegiea gigantea]|uniref:Inactive shikimate kinase like 1, chloroplastic n=1 Tax=Carnegiea gigantea TaxID=171969 RepID=A0A9Q1JG44_9CARY|nr:hypothetical protein Cgig2_025111 [Carnegiea gigantea]
MEISPAIHSISSNAASTQFLHPRLEFQLPFFSRASTTSRSNCPLCTSLSSSALRQKASICSHKWPQRLTTTRALYDETASTADTVTERANADPPLAVKKIAAELHAGLKGTSIFLVGMNSAMKTSVGKLIADVLRYYYFDSDSVVEEVAGEDPSGKSFKERDEDGFCESETEVLRQLSSMGWLVVNAGNGAVQSSTNLALLRHGISVWLDFPLDMIANGLIGDDGQSTPDSFSEALSCLTKLYEENRAGYAIADATISLQSTLSALI